ncbi:SNARE associated Golgi protein [uncultured archaeon]|nr:SNARE associated Golgi protein [uncultured archaeon]
MIEQLALGIIGLTSDAITAFMGQYGYVAVFVLMALEAASLPIPSEVVLPLAGYLGATGELGIIGSFIAAIAGSILGMTADYYIAYFIEKDVVYKHLHWFHIKRENVEAFDAWFNDNGRFTVFISRLLPVVRGLINFPAGFAKMRLRDFYIYSIAGAAIWTALLMGLGYYAHGLIDQNVYYLTIALAVFAIALYALYKYVMKKILLEIKRNKK